MAEIPDGTFNVIGDTIEVLAGSGLTRTQLLRLQVILDQARAGNMSPGQAAQAVTDEAPTLKPLMERFGPKMGAALMVFLSFVVQLLIQQGYRNCETILRPRRMYSRPSSRPSASAAAGSVKPIDRASYTSA